MLTFMAGTLFGFYLCGCALGAQEVAAALREHGDELDIYPPATLTWAIILVVLQKPFELVFGKKESK